MNNEQNIQQTIQMYFDAMYESDREKTLAVFHPAAKITGYMGKNLVQQDVESFAEFVGTQQPSAKAQNLPIRLETVSIEVAGATAVARVRDDYIGKTFLDTLSFLKIDDNWIIYNKLFHIEA
ncbi:MAG: hypothetical protein ACI8RT_000463 [Candidatus Azotimanducaceae bacterium]|jgi:hypothetical protein